MNRKRITAWLLLVLTLGSVLLLGGCKAGTAGTAGTLGTPGLFGNTTDPELGSWRASVLFSSMKDLPLYERLPLAIALGNTAFEVELEIAPDGTFSYETNYNVLKESVSDLALWIIKLFWKDFNLDLVLDRILEGVLPEIHFGKDWNCYGDYERAGDGSLIFTTTEGDVLHFKLTGNKLIQLNEDGQMELRFLRDR